MATTSHFGALIYEFARSQNLTIRELSERVEGTTSSTFSKIRGGNYSKLTEERLNSILDTLAPNDKNARALMVCAYLWDMCPAAYHVLIKIEPQRGENKSIRQANKKTNLPHPVIEHLPNMLDTIGKAASANPNFLEHVSSLSKLSSVFLKDTQ